MEWLLSLLVSTLLFTNHDPVCLTCNWRRNICGNYRMDVWKSSRDGVEIKRSSTHTCTFTKPMSKKNENNFSVSKTSPTTLSLPLGPSLLLRHEIGLAHVWNPTHTIVCLSQRSAKSASIAPPQPTLPQPHHEHTASRDQAYRWTQLEVGVWRNSYYCVERRYCGMETLSLFGSGVETFAPLLPRSPYGTQHRI